MTIALTTQSNMHHHLGRCFAKVLGVFTAARKPKKDLHREVARVSN